MNYGKETIDQHAFDDPIEFLTLLNSQVRRSSYFSNFSLAERSYIVVVLFTRMVSNSLVWKVCDSIGKNQFKSNLKTFSRYLSLYAKFKDENGIQAIGIQTELQQQDFYKIISSIVKGEYGYFIKNLYTYMNYLNDSDKKIYSSILENIHNEQKLIAELGSDMKFQKFNNSAIDYLKFSSDNFTNVNVIGGEIINDISSNKSIGKSRSYSAKIILAVAKLVGEEKGWIKMKDYPNRDSRFDAISNYINTNFGIYKSGKTYRVNDTISERIYNCKCTMTEHEEVISLLKELGHKSIAKIYNQNWINNNGI